MNPVQISMLDFVILLLPQQHHIESSYPDGQEFATLLAHDSTSTLSTVQSAYKSQRH
jgi:hypothetical protein